MVTRSTTAAARLQVLMARRAAMEHGLNATCMVCGGEEEGREGQWVMILCDVAEVDGSRHGVHVGCMVSECERDHARACIADEALPWHCPWHADCCGREERPVVAYRGVSGASSLLETWEESSVPLESAEAAMLPAGTEVYVRQAGGHLCRGLVREPGAVKDAEPGSARARSARCPVDAEVLYFGGGASPRMRIFGEGAREVRVALK